MDIPFARLCGSLLCPAFAKEQKRRPKQWVSHLDFLDTIIVRFAVMR